MAYPRKARARAHKTTRVSAGSYTFTSTTLAAVDATNLSLSLKECQAGDVIEVSLSTQVTTAASNSLALDVATIVSAAATKYASSGTATAATDGVGGWFTAQSNTNAPRAGSVRITLAAGDIDSTGTATVQLYGKITTGTTATIRAETSSPTHFAVANLGPVQS